MIDSTQGALELLLVRHGETEWNRTHRYLGSSDEPLNATGLRQAEQLAAVFTETRIDVILSSDMARTMQTAQAVSAVCGVETVTDPLLRELSFGIFEGLTYNEVQDQYPTELADWQADFEKAPMGGEKLSTLSKRVEMSLNRIRGEYAGKQVLVVSHGGVIREILRQSLGLPAAGHWYFSIAAASITKLGLYASGPVLYSLNAVGHLD